MLARGANKVPDARLEKNSVYFDIMVCHPNAESYQDLALEQLYRQYDNEKKRCKQVELWMWKMLIYPITAHYNEWYGQGLQQISRQSS